MPSWDVAFFHGKVQCQPYANNDDNELEDIYVQTGLINKGLAFKLVDSFHIEAQVYQVLPG